MKRMTFLWIIAVVILFPAHSQDTRKQVENLATLLDNQDTQIRFSAIEEIEKCVLLPMTSEQEKLYLDLLVTAMHDSNNSVSSRAALILRKMGATRAVPRLLPLLQAETSMARYLAAETLGELGYRGAIGPLIELLSDGNPYMVGFAARSLGKLKAGEASESLTKVLLNEYSYPYGRMMAAEALAEIGDKSSIPALLQCMEDRQRLVRLAAAHALGEMKALEALEGLRRLAADSDQDVRDTARSALLQIENSQAKESDQGRTTDKNLPTAEGKSEKSRQIPTAETPAQRSEFIFPYLRLTQTGPAHLRLGESGDYGLTIENPGDEATSEIVVRAMITEWFEYSARRGPINLKWELGKLGAHETKKLNWSLVTLSRGSFVIAAEILCRDKQQRVQWTTEVTAPDLELTITGPRLVYNHRSATYTVKIVNRGNGPAWDMKLEYLIPSSFDFIRSEPRATYRPEQAESPAVLVWTFPEIEPGADLMIKVEARARAGWVDLHTATLSSSSSHLPVIVPICRQLQTKVLRCTPAMHISTYDTEDPCEVSKQTIYVIEIRNEGTSSCTNVLMTSRLPTAMEFIETEGPTNYRWDATNHQVEFETFPILPPGDKLTYKVRCKAVEPAYAKHAAILKYDQFEGIIIDEEGTSIYD